MLVLRVLFLVLLATQTGWAQAQSPVRGMDHIPVVVRDLEKAEADFKRLGFAIKPGRPHANGIRNVHVKFPDGTEIELITSPQAVDRLSSEYRAKMESGEGPVYFGLYAPDKDRLNGPLQEAGAVREDEALAFPAKHPLHPLFFGSRNKSPTDRPEHFAHPNGALRLSGLWVRDLAGERALLANLGVTSASAKGCGPLQGGATIARLPEGDLYLVSPQSGTGTVAAAQVEVRSLTGLEQHLVRNGIKTNTYPACEQRSVWVPPTTAHGIWLQFVEAR